MEQRWSFGFLLKRHRLAAGLTKMYVKPPAFLIFRFCLIHFWLRDWSP